MLIVENKKIELKILKLKLEIEERQTKLEELEKLLESNNKIINSVDSINYKNLTKFNKTDAELYSVMSELPEEKKLGWSPEGKFKCNLCLQTFNEGFNDIHTHNLFFYKNPQYKHLSNYMIKHHCGSICYKNQFCSYCDNNNIEYSQFRFRTERVRHMKNHSDDGICIPCNKPDNTKQEVIDMFKSKWQNPRTELKIQKKEPEPETETETEPDDGSSSTETESILDRIGKAIKNRDPTKIQKPRISLKEKLALKEKEEKAKQKQQEKEDKQRRIKLWALSNENNKKLGLPPLPELILSDGESDYDWSDTEEFEELSQSTYTDITTEAEEDAVPIQKQENVYQDFSLETRPTYLT